MFISAVAKHAQNVCKHAQNVHKHAQKVRKHAQNVRTYNSSPPRFRPRLQKSAAFLEIMRLKKNHRRRSDFSANYLRWP